MARSSWACSGSGSSPISSRNRVPPSASANAPSRALVAPVKAPRSWPNSSLPASSGTMVVQSTTTKSPLSGRGSRSWISRAISSLPVPLSPMTSTEACENAATSTTERTTERQRGLLPTSTLLTSGELARPSTVDQRSSRETTWSAASGSRGQASTSLAPARDSAHCCARLGRRPMQMASTAELAAQVRNSSSTVSSTCSKTTAPNPSTAPVGKVRPIPARSSRFARISGMPGGTRPRKRTHIDNATIDSSDVCAGPAEARTGKQYDGHPNELVHSPPAVVMSYPYVMALKLCERSTDAGSVGDCFYLAECREYASLRAATMRGSEQRPIVVARGSPAKVSSSCRGRHAECADFKSDAPPPWRT